MEILYQVYIELIYIILKKQHCQAVYLLVKNNILNEKIISPNRWYNSCDCTYPLQGNVYSDKYKNLLINLIKKNNIEVIYLIKPLENLEIYQYLSKSCFKETRISEHLSSYELNDCYEIKG